jgi:hypothetical protein
MTALLYMYRPMVSEFPVLHIYLFRRLTEIVFSRLERSMSPPSNDDSLNFENLFENEGLKANGDNLSAIIWSIKVQAN